MPLYTCTQNDTFLRELGRKLRAGESVELPPGVFESYRMRHPGLFVAVAAPESPVEETVILKEIAAPKRKPRAKK